MLKNADRVNIGRIDSHKYRVIPSVEHEDAESGEEVKIMGRWFKKSPECKNMLYIGSNEKFLNTLALALGPEWNI